MAEQLMGSTEDLESRLQQPREPIAEADEPQQQPMMAAATPQPPANPWANIWQHTQNIHNPIARTAARLGTIMGAATSGFPGAERLIEMNIQQQESKQKLAQQQAEHEQDMQQKAEQHELQMSMQREIAGMGVAGRQKVAETQVAGKESVAETAAAAKAQTHPPIQDLERQARQAFASGDMELYKSSLQQISDIKKAETGAKPRQEVTLQTPDGKRVAGFKGPEGLMLEGGEKAPEGTLLYQAATTGQTRTTTIWDPKTGFPMDMQYNPDSGRYDIPIGVSATGAAGGRMAQAGAVQRAGENLIQDIQAHKAQLGDIEAWVKKYGLDTPIADPDLAGLQAELASFAALQPAMHGFRGTNALNTFEKIIGGLQKDPDATIASIKGIMKTSGALVPPVPPITQHGGTSFADWKAGQK